MAKFCFYYSFLSESDRRGLEVVERYYKFILLRGDELQYIRYLLLSIWAIAPLQSFSHNPTKPLVSQRLIVALTVCS